MKVKDAIALLQDMPQDADLIASTDGLAAKLPTGAMRSDEVRKTLLGGFSAQELKSEEYELFLYEKENLVILSLVLSSKGTSVV